MSFVLYRSATIAVLHGSIEADGAESDIQQPLLPDDVLGEKPVSEWPLGVTDVPQEAGQLLMEQLFALEQEVS